MRVRSAARNAQHHDRWQLLLDPIGLGPLFGLVCTFELVYACVLGSSLANGQNHKHEIRIRHPKSESVWSGDIVVAPQAGGYGFAWSLPTDLDNTKSGLDAVGQIVTES